MKRPSFQFYPADWRKDANLRRCSPAARGVWMDVLCVLHDSDEYGIVRWPLKEIASAAGASIAHLRELVEKRVLKGCDKGRSESLIYTPRHGRKEGEPVTLIPEQEGPLWFSARFVRDEYVRTIRGESSRFGEGKGDSPKGAPKPPFGDGSSSSTSSSPSGYSVPNGTGGDAAKPVEEFTKAELWSAGKALLESQGMSQAEGGSFIGKLVSDYGNLVVIEAVRTAVATQPAKATEYLTGYCLRAAGTRQPKDIRSVTVPSKPGRDPALVKLDEDAKKAAPIPAAVKERLAALKGGLLQ